MNSANTREEGPFEGLLIELHYLPCIQYFTHLLQYEKVVLEAHEHYPKQTYRNRCRVRTAQQVMTLSVPVSKGPGKPATRDVKIDYHQPWLKDHWRTIASAYGKAPFFPDYAPFFEKILFKKYTFLFDLNLELLTNCLFLLGVKKNIAITTGYREEAPEGVKDLRNAVILQKEGITEVVHNFVDYRQVFGSNFAPNLSIVDLLFCQGPAAKAIISQSIFL